MFLQLLMVPIGLCPCTLWRLSPTWALCMRGRAGLIQVQKYVKRPVQSIRTIFIGQISERNIRSSFCHLDTVPPFKQILHTHSTHNKYSHQNWLIRNIFWLEWYSFLLTTLSVAHIQRLAPICIQCGCLHKKRCWSTRYRHTGGSPPMELTVGQFTNKPTSSQSSQELVSLRTG